MTKMAEERSEGDPNSYANPKESLVTHLDIHLEVDFQARILKGYVDLTIDRIFKSADLVCIGKVSYSFIYNSILLNSLNVLNETLIIFFRFWIREILLY